MKAAAAWLAVAIMLLAGACAGHHSAAPQPAPAAPAADITAEAMAWADSMLAGLTLEERVGQLVMPSVFARADSADIDRLRRYITDQHIGGVVLLRGDIPSAAVIADTLQGLSPAGAFVAIDAEWGLAMRLDSAPAYTPNAMLPDATDDQAMFDYGRRVAGQCRRVGINMVLGPVADVAISGSSPVASRSFGADPERVANLATAYARGLEAGGVVSVAKHFPGLGASDADTHRSIAINPGSAASLDSTHLLPFRRYIDAGLSGVMIGHVEVPALDSSGRAASVSPHIMVDLLRADMGFHGLVITDALNMGGASGASAADAIGAGADIVLCPADTRQAIGSLLEAIASGQLGADVVNDRARRVLFFKYIFGVAARRHVAPATPADLAGSPDF